MGQSVIHQPLVQNLVLHRLDSAKRSGQLLRPQGQLPLVALSSKLLLFLLSYEQSLPGVTALLALDLQLRGNLLAVPFELGGQVPLRVDHLLEEAHLLFQPSPPRMSPAKINLRTDVETLHPPPGLLEGLELPLQSNPPIGGPLVFVPLTIIL